MPSHPEIPVETKVYVFDDDMYIKNVNITVKNVRISHKNFGVLPEIRAMGNEKFNRKFYDGRWYEYHVRSGLFNGKLSHILIIHLFPYRYIEGKLYHAEFNVSIKYYMERGEEKNNYDMLIISPSSLSSYAYQLANFKEKKGIKTKVAILENILRMERGSDDAEKIKYYIKKEIEENGIKYVILFGDADLLPVRYVKTDMEEPSEFPTDLYYADIYRGDGSFSSWDENGNGIYGERDDGVDFIPDVYVGRLPVDNGNEASILIDKIVHFEIPPQRALFIGTELFPDTPVREGEFLKNYIAEDLRNMNVEKLYEIDGNANAERIAEEINKGVMFVNFASHGNPSSMVWGNGSWSISDMHLLKNGYTLPYVFAMACLTNAFDETDCLGEKFLLHEGGGAIAYVGSTRVAYVYVGEAIKNSLSGYLDYLFFKSYYDGFNTTGSIFSNAIEYYVMRTPFFTDVDRLTAMEFNLLGDPSIYLPSLINTSRAYVKNPVGSEIDVYANAIHYNGSAKLYYREEGKRKWEYFGESKKPYHWKFIPPHEGMYELCSIVDGENFPLYGDCYCIFDETVPQIKIEKPESGIYFFNKKIMDTRNITIAIGKITIEGRAMDNLLKRVQIKVDGVVEYSSSAPSFVFEWDGIKFGMHDIEISAQDMAGNTGSKIIKICRIT